MVLNLEQQSRKTQGAQMEASFASLENLYGRVSIAFYTLSGLQHFQILSAQYKGYTVAVAGPCDGTRELSRHTGFPSSCRQLEGHGE